MKNQKRGGKIFGLAVALVAVILCGIVFIGAVSGWFDDKVKIDAEYYSENPELMDLDTKGYDGLVAGKKSFVIFVDQYGCTTADKLREYVGKYMNETGMSVYRMMFDDVKESSLHENVRYYPSVVVVSRGNVKGFLRADSDEDAGAYNDYDAFKQWIGKYL